MKIAISEIQQKQIVASVDSSISLKITGGAILRGSTSSLSIFNRNVALANANIFGLVNTSANGSISSATISGKSDGKGFSFSSSSSAATSG